MPSTGRTLTAASAVSAGGISYAPPSALADGPHTAVVSVADLARNAASLTWHFTTDTLAPVVKITSHQSDQYLNTRTITVSGTVDDPAASVTVNGTPAQVLGNTFTLSGLVLVEGGNAVAVEAKDAAGNSGSEALILNLDTIAPEVTIGAPQADAYVKTPAIAVTGTVNEAVLSITVNGVPAAITGTSYSASITLVEGPNPITVTANDRADNPGTATRNINLDTGAPTVTITAPLADSFISTPTITVAGTVNEPVAAVTVNGVPANLAGTNFSLAGVQLTEGPNTIVLEAKDRAGNPGSQNVSLTLDTILPEITVFAPGQNSFVKTPKITFSGTVTETNPAGVWVNELPAQLNNGEFTLADVSLSEGLNIVPVRARDLAGHDAVVPVTVTLDTVVPQVTITTPLPGLTRVNHVTVAGWVSESGTSVKINSSIPAMISGQTYTLTDFVLQEGPNTITVLAADRAENSGSASVSVTLDSMPPAAPVISQPATPTKIQPITLTGTAEPLSVVTLYTGTVPGTTTVLGSVTADSQGSFSLPGVALAEGENGFSALCSDTAGNTSPFSLPVTVLLDTRAPVITVGSPANNSFSSVKEITLTGSLDEPASLLINGAAATVNENLTFSQVVSLQGGTNTIMLSAADPAGNSASLEWFVQLDTTPPVVTITSPGPGLVNTPRISVAGTVSKVLTTVTVNTIPAQVSGLGFSLNDFVLNEGSNTITVEAVDRAGNKGNAIVAIALDTQGPVIALQAPAQAAAGATVSLSVTGTDASGITLVEVTANGLPLWSVTPNSEISTQNSLVYSVSPDLAPGTLINLAARAKDALTNPGTASAQILISQGPSGPGYIQGEVYDDARGLRLEGAEVIIFSAANGRELTRMTTGADGGYFTEAEADTYIISVSKPGYTAAERVVTAKAGEENNRSRCTTYAGQCGSESNRCGRRQGRNTCLRGLCDLCGKYRT